MYLIVSVTVESTSPPPPNYHGNVSDSTSMPLPTTHFLRIRNPKNSAVDSDFSVQKKVTTKAAKVKGGKKDDQVLKTVEQGKNFNL